MNLLQRIWGAATGETARRHRDVIRNLEDHHRLERNRAQEYHLKVVAELKQKLTEASNDQ
jgi:hypothetical protein